MQIKRVRKSSLNLLESGTLTDLAFLLIVFFVVLAVSYGESGFLFELPAKASGRSTVSNEFFCLDLKADGSLFWEGREIGIGDLKRQLGFKLANSPDAVLYLQISPDCVYRSVVEVIDLAKELQVKHLSFQTETIVEE